MATNIQLITPFLWFDRQAEEAAGFYVSIFPNSQMGSVTRYVPESAVTLKDSDAGKTQRVMKAMLGMKKIDVEELKRAADGK